MGTLLGNGPDELLLEVPAGIAQLPDGQNLGAQGAVGALSVLAECAE